MSGQAPAPLDGVRVLDLGTMLAAPYGATLLGDFGADVIKVESPAGDLSRHLGPEREGERSPFLSLNRNKRGVVLDLRKPEARAVFARLVGTSDVVITNVREPALSEFGLAYEQLCEHRRDLIWVGVSAFGPDGPYARRPGIDFLAQGYGGLVALNGDPAGPPVRVTVPLVDVMTSLLVVSAVLAALRVRERSGEGQRIDISLLDAVIHAQCSGLGAYFLTGEVTPRTGNRSQYFAPSGVYTCADGRRVCITCPSEKFFVNLCRAFGVKWDRDRRFRTIEARLRHEDELDQRIAEQCSRVESGELIERLVAADVLVAPVNEIPEVAEDPQVRHNGMLVEVPHARLGKVRVTGPPIRFARTPASVRRGPPALGEHTDEVLAELGYGPEERERLRESGAVAPSPRRAGPAG